MADIKISALPTYPNATLAAGDFFVVASNVSGTLVSYKATTSQIPSGQVVTPYNATISGSYAVGSILPFYSTTTTSPVNWNLSSVGTNTSIAATVSDGVTIVNLTSGTSGATAALRLTGITFGGTATGTGSTGISRSVALSGSIAAVTFYTPAFYGQTTTNAPPAFVTNSTQTAGAAQGSTITYSVPAASTAYNWIATQRPLANIFISTPFGNSPLVADVTAPTQTISGQVFSVYGFTGLSTTVPVVLIIT